MADPVEEITNGLANFIVIRWDETGDLEIDLGDINHYEARGVLHSVHKKLCEMDPDISIKANGIKLGWLSDEEG